MPAISLPTSGDEPQGLLRTPKGTPIAYSPLMAPAGICALSLLPEPNKGLMMMKSLGGGDSPLHRTTSNSSTQLPDEDFSFHRTVSNSSQALDEEVLCFGLPALGSELGQWAQAFVGKHTPVQPGLHEYLVDNSTLHADTLGLAFRKSKNPWDRDHEMHGPTWSSVVRGVDEGDGWLRVGDHFLPMDLVGAPVLLRRGGEAMMDGPALTQDGRVLDLDGGSAMHFSSTKGSTYHDMLKEAHRLRRAACLAHRSCEAEACIEACEACALDTSGTVHGALPEPVQLGRGPSIPKRLHRRLQQRRRRAAARFEDGGGLGKLGRDDSGEPARLCMGGDGKVFLFLELSSRERVERHQRAASRLRQRAVCQGPAFVADMQGVIHL